MIRNTTGRATDSLWRMHCNASKCESIAWEYFKWRTVCVIRSGFELKEFKAQAMKGMRLMPWRWRAKKDVDGCEKLR